MPSPASWIAHTSGQKAMCDRDATADGDRPAESGAGRTAPLSPSSRLNELDPLYRYSARYADTLAPVTAAVAAATATTAAAPVQAGLPELRRRNRIVSDSESWRPVSTCLGSVGCGSGTTIASAATATAAAQQPEGKAQRSRESARFRRRQDARYRTQPVTFDEIKEIDELLMDDVSTNSGSGGSGSGAEQAQRQLRQQDSCPAGRAVLLAPVIQQPAVGSGGGGGGSKARRDSE